MSAIELKPFLHEAEVAIEGDQILRLVINFAVIARLEGLLGKGMDEIIGELATSTTVMGKVLWAMTREHHRDIDLDQIAGVMFSKSHGTAVMAVLGDLVRTAFNIGDDGEGEQSRPPRKPSSGVSRASARSGSRPASIRTASGRKPRARS